MSKLLPCPFCGSDRTFVHRGNDEYGDFAAIGCDGCGAGSRQHYYCGEDAAEFAAGAWNRRSALPQQPSQPQQQEGGDR